MITFLFLILANPVCIESCGEKKKLSPKINVKNIKKSSFFICQSKTISKNLLIRFDPFLEEMISTAKGQYNVGLDSTKPVFMVS